MADKRSLAFALLGDGKSLGKALNGVATDADHAHHSLSRLGKLAIGAGVVGGAVLLAKKLKDVGDETVGAYTKAAKGAGALQRLIGGSVEDASRLQFAAHEAGVGEESFTKSLRLLEKNLGTATKAQVVKTKATHQEIVTVNRLKDGHIVHVKALKTVTDVTARTIKVSKDLGFTYKDAHGKLLPMRDVILNVADKFSKMPNGVEKTTLALKLFGRAGTDMIPVLNKGRDGVQELMNESDKLGKTMSAKDVKAVKDYTLQQRHLHAAMDGLKITLGRELFPIFTAWSDSLAKNAPKIIVWVKSHLPQFRKEAKKVADFIKDDLEPAFAHMVDGLVKGGQKLDQKAGPFFRYIGDHKDMFTKIAKDAVILGAVLKASSFIRGLSLLRGGGSLGKGGAAGVVTGAKPVPVFVTNPGFAPGGKVPPVVPGGGAGGKFFTPGMALPAVAYGIAAWNEQQKYKTNQDKRKGIESSVGKLRDLASTATKDSDNLALIGAADKIAHASGVISYDPKKAGQYVIDPKVPEDVRAAGMKAADFAFEQRQALSKRTRQEDRLEDPRASRQATADTQKIVTAITQGTSGRPSVTLNNPHFNGIVDVKAFMAEIDRQARVAALGNKVPGAGRRGEVAP